MNQEDGRTMMRTFQGDPDRKRSIAEIQLLCGWSHHKKQQKTHKEMKELYMDNANQQWLQLCYHEKQERNHKEMREIYMGEACKLSKESKDTLASRIGTEHQHGI